MTVEKNHPVICVSPIVHQLVQTRVALVGVRKELDNLRQFRQILSTFIVVVFAGIGVGQALAAYSSAHPTPEEDRDSLPGQQVAVPVTIGGEPGSLTPTATVYVRLLDTSPDQFVNTQIQNQPEGTVFYHLHDGAGKSPCLLFVHGIYEDPSVFSELYRQAYASGYDVAAVKLAANADFISNGHLLAVQMDLLRQRVPDIEGRLIIVGHSMGALDAYEALGRYHAVPVAALVSLGTPWEGSPLATILNRVAQLPQNLASTTPWFGIAVDRCLTPERVKHEITALHNNNPALQTLNVVSVAGTIVSPESVRSPFLQAGYAALSALGYRENDGAVPTQAQQYPYGGTVIHIHADHHGYMQWNLLKYILDTELRMPPPSPSSSPAQPSGTASRIPAQDTPEPDRPQGQRMIDALRDFLARLVSAGSFRTI
ncbi:MAG: alpha/beta fold hydrolase [Alicyclobacillaceae bacterium]|nr:alpha/beta fold hydrolase [Alicyclobacillaceae bacterium]